MDGCDNFENPWNYPPAPSSFPILCFAVRSVLSCSRVYRSFALQFGRCFPVQDWRLPMLRSPFNWAIAILCPARLLLTFRVLMPVVSLLILCYYVISFPLSFGGNGGPSNAQASLGKPFNNEYLKNNELEAGKNAVPSKQNKMGDMTGKEQVRTTSSILQEKEDQMSALQTEFAYVHHQVAKKDKD